MATRRVLLFAALIAFAVAFVLAHSEKTGVLEATCCYLPSPAVEA